MEKGKRILIEVSMCFQLFTALFSIIVLPVKGDPGFLYGSDTYRREWGEGAWMDYYADIDGSYSGTI
jgi:hypothetical protein